MLGLFLPQGLFTGCFLNLENSSPNLATVGSFLTHQVPARTSPPLPMTQSEEASPHSQWHHCFILFLAPSLPCFPGGSVMKNLPWDLGSIPESGRPRGEGNGNPLQYSCLENPMDRRAFWAIVHGVTKRWTWLSNYHTYISLPEWPSFSASSFIEM